MNIIDFVVRLGLRPGTLLLRPLRPILRPLRPNLRPLRPILLSSHKCFACDDLFENQPLSLH